MSVQQFSTCPCEAYFLLHLSLKIVFQIHNDEIKLHLITNQKRVRKLDSSSNSREYSERFENWCNLEVGGNYSKGLQFYTCFIINLLK